MASSGAAIRVAVALAAVLLGAGDAAAAPVAAVDDAMAAQEPASEPASEPEAAWVPAGERELGLRLGLAMGGRVTPGGLRLAGVWLYRLSEDDWFEGSMGFTFGGGGEACFLDRDAAFTCSHGPVAGAAADLMVGIRRFVTPREHFAPYLRAGLGLRLVRFRDDDVAGVAVPLVLGAGFRTRVNDRITVGGDAALEAGAGLFDHALGLEPQLGMAAQAVMEVRLD